MTLRHSPLLENLATAIVLLDRSGRIVWTNPVWNKTANHLGLKQTWVGVSYIDILLHDATQHSSPATDLVTGLRAVLEGHQRAFQYDYSWNTSEGTSWYTETVNSTEDERGHVVVSRLDVTKLYRTAAAVDEENAVFKSAFDEAPLAMLLIDLNGKVTRLNRCATQQFGYGQAEIVGKSLPTLYSDYRTTAQTCEFASENTAPASRQERTLLMRRKDGSSFLAICSSALLHNRHGDPTCALMTVHDLTAALREEVHSRSRSPESVGRLNGEVAHEFDNLLTIISGNLQLLMMTQDAAEKTNAISEATHAVSRAAQLTKKLATFAAATPIRREKL